MNVAEKLLVRRAVRVVRHGERTRRRKLERELAAYTTPADRLEIETILDRYPDIQTAGLRPLLPGPAVRDDAGACGMRSPAV